MTIILILVSTIIYYLINFLTWYVTEKKPYIPQFLNRKPYICRKCLNWWLNLFIGLILSIEVNYLFMFIIILDILDTIAIYLDEKNNIYSINDIDENELDGK